MQTSTFEIVIIGGSFTIIGAIVGGVIGHLSSKQAIKHEDRLKAGANLRATFAPEIAKMKELVPESQGAVIDKILHAAFDKHAIAIECFSFYVCSDQKEQYYKAWNDYSKVRDGKRFSDYCHTRNSKKLFEERINAILEFTKI